MTRTAVITGVGAVTPLGVGARTLHERWSAGVSGIEDGYGRASEFEPTEHLSVKEARRSDRFTQFALAASKEALEDAGWEDGPPGDPDRTACVIGTGIGGIGTLESQHMVMRDQGRAEDLTALDPAADGERRLGRGRDEVRPARPVVRDRVGVRGRRPRDRDGRAADPLRRRRPRRHRWQRGGDHAACHRGVRQDGRALRQRHLTPVRPPPRRLRHGRGRGRARARGGGGREGARGAHPRLHPRLRVDIRRLPPHRSRAERSRGVEGHRAGPEGRGGCRSTTSSTSTPTVRPRR